VRIGLLTYHSVCNFGANLQTLSTVEYLKRNGHDPVVVNWVPESLELYYRSTIPSEQQTMHRQFVEKYLNVTRLCRSEADIVQVVEQHGIQGLIIGSDAVLKISPFLSRVRFPTRKIISLVKPTIDCVYPNPFWGNIVSEIKHKIPIILMSASSQNAAFKYVSRKTRLEMGHSLSRFRYISVRDVWTKKMVTYLSSGGIIPEITPDPVFAFNDNVSEQRKKDELLQKYNIPDNYILVSFRDSKTVTRQWILKLEKLASSKGLVCVALAMPQGLFFMSDVKQKIPTPLGPMDWYSLIKYSKGYIGQNMHPIVVAIHNAVPFYSFDQYGKISLLRRVNQSSSKIYDILKIAGFEENRIATTVRRYKPPDPNIVLNEIVKFDKVKCKEFSNRYRDKYMEMMQGICENIVNEYGAFV